MKKTIGKIAISVECIMLALLMFQNPLQEEEEEVDRYRLISSIYEKQLAEAVSNPRIIDEEILERKKLYDLNNTDYNNLLRIVEAEAGGEGEEGKLLVANVIFNRVNSRKFPNTVTEVVFQSSGGKTQFAPTRDGRFYSVRVTEETVRAVDRAIYGEDISGGALYFVAVSKASQDKVSWFQRKLKKVCSYGGHDFYR
ncbi:MAG: cell wall hydrolase [Roseburia sp.]|nr:cell wall hydrolase [Roseburia sp.]MCM1278916.1 cell wall hydrolase [Robinsoniella sp.]